MVEVLEHALSGVKRICLEAFPDERGFFKEVYRKPIKGIDADFVQDNHSYSVQKTIRGMHFQAGPGQAKLITALVGTIYDVFVDIRPDSPTFGQWGAHVLAADRHEQLFIPAGFAHGFAVLSDEAHVFYKVSTVYDPKLEKTFAYNDPKVGIEWPFEDPIVSDRDRLAPTLDEAIS